MGLLAFVLTMAAAYFAYIKTRAFVRNKLRYVEALQRSSAPWKAGLVATLVAAPITWVLPVISTAAAVLFGTAVGFGVAAGRRDLRRGGLTVNA